MQGAHVTRSLGSHRACQGQPGQPGSDHPHGAAPCRGESAVYLLNIRQKGRKQGPDRRNRVLQVVVHGQDYVVTRGPNTAEQGVLLTIIATEAHAAHPRVMGCRSLDNASRPVIAAILDQQKPERVSNLGQRGKQPFKQLRQRVLAAIDRSNDRQRGQANPAPVLLAEHSGHSSTASLFRQ